MQLHELLLLAYTQQVVAPPLPSTFECFTILPGLGWGLGSAEAHGRETTHRDTQRQLPSWFWRRKRKVKPNGTTIKRMPQVPLWDRSAGSLGERAPTSSEEKCHLLTLIDHKIHPSQEIPLPQPRLLRRGARRSVSSSITKPTLRWTHSGDRRSMAPPETQNQATRHAGHLVEGRTEPNL